MREWDAFISHASEDRDAFVRPLVEALRQLGARVWYSEFSLKVGDSLSRSIDKGLAKSRYGIVVVSPHFIGKPWPERELAGLVTRDVDQGRVILPIWHGVIREQVVEFSPPLADKMAIVTTDISAEDVALQLLQAIRPDLYARHPRAELERLASGEGLGELQYEIERTREQLEAAREELAEYRCPYCGSPVGERISVPLDEEQKHWGGRENFECGYVAIDGHVEQPCPSDDRFPKFEDYQLEFRCSPDESHWKWHCLALAKTEWARCVHLGDGLGETKEEAERTVRERYERVAKKWDS